MSRKKKKRKKKAVHRINETARKQSQNESYLKPARLSRKIRVGKLLLSLVSWFRLSSAGRIPAPVKIGGSVRWRLSDIQRWLEWDCPSRKEFNSRMEAEATNPPLRTDLGD